MAGDWKLTDSVTASLDVVDRSGRDASSGVVASISPRISLNGRGGRTTADVNYQLTTSIGTGDTDPRGLSHNLTATGRLEAVEDRLFIGANAAARLAGRTATSGPVDPVNARSDGVQSYSVGIQPEYRQHINRYADFVSQNSIDYVTYSGDDRDGGNDSTSARIHAGIRSGRHFSRLSWSLDASREETDYDSASRTSDTRSSYTAGVGYRIDRTWSVNGSLGYEKNDVETTRSDTDGLIWNVGTSWAPNPRTSLSASYGERYFGEVISADLRHRTKRTVLSLGLSRDVTNRRAFELVDSFFFLVDDTGNLIRDPVTGNPLIVNIPQLDLTDEDFVNTQLRGAIAVSGRRTTVTVTGTVSNREFEVSGEDETSLALALSASRRLGANINASAAVQYTRADGTTRGDSDSYDVSLSLSRRLSERTSAAINVLHREQDATSNDGYTENRIGVSVSSSFL